MMHGEYGISDVCLSILNVLGSEGAHGKILLPLKDEEVSLLRKSAECLRGVIDQLDI